MAHSAAPGTVKPHRQQSKLLATASDATKAGGRLMALGTGARGKQLLTTARSAAPTASAAATYQFRFSGMTARGSMSATWTR